MQKDKQQNAGMSACLKYTLFYVAVICHELCLGHFDVFGRKHHLKIIINLFQNYVSVIFTSAAGVKTYNVKKGN